MNREKQRIAIAEACGWTELKMLRELAMLGGYNQIGGLRTTKDHLVGLSPHMNANHPSLLSCDGVTRFEPEQSWWISVPDYLSDLNAMHEAEKVLMDKGGTFIRYCVELERIAKDKESAMVATSTQRAEAFLRTLNLWC